MKDRRRDASDISAQLEDLGLFKTGLVEVPVELTPRITRTYRQDLMVTGLVKGQLEIDVIFAGRRLQDAAPLLATLRKLKQEALATAAAKGVLPPDLLTIRSPVKIEGSWRPRFLRDKSGWETRTYQLLAARWAVVGRDGVVTVGGQTAISVG